MKNRKESMMMKRPRHDTIKLTFILPSETHRSISWGFICRSSSLVPRPSLFVIGCSLFCGLTILLSLSSPVHAAQTCKESILATTPSSNFTIHKDGTVTQKTTGLMWMRCSLGQKWNGKTCTGAAANYSWKGALQAGNHFKFAGYDDWRLPSKNELESIVEESCHSPAINDSIFPATPAAFFWSSSPYAGFSRGAWSVDFGFGSVNPSDKDGGIPVRLVRGGE